MTHREMADDCIFCTRNNGTFVTIAENNHFYSFFDNNPVALGHALIIPKWHVLSYFDLNQDEVVEMHELAKRVQEIIRSQYNPNGYTIGINDGEAAGRTIHHLHLHIIPRYVGDVEDPRGGVRHIIPGKGSY